MNKAFSMANTIKELRTAGFVIEAGMPMGYAPVYPALTEKNGHLCAVFPFAKYKKTGKVDNTLVYPIRYTVTAEIPEMKFIGFEALEYNTVFGKNDFDKPVGTFRHDAIKNIGRTQYMEMQTRAFSLYDVIISDLVDGNDTDQAVVKELRELLNLLIEPFLKVEYKILTPGFYEKFIQ